MPPDHIALVDGLPPIDDLPTASIVVPAYNEGAILATNLGVLYDYMHTLDDRYHWELLVVDDGSSDDTGSVADAFAVGRPEVRVLHHRVNFQLGQALRYAFGQCRGDYIVTLDSDLTYSPDHVGRLLDEIHRSQARIVIASPYATGGRTTNVPFRRRALSRGANRILSVSAKGRITTITGMVRAYDRRFLQSLNLKALDTAINGEIIYKAQILRARIVEIPAHLDWTVPEGGTARRSSVRVTKATMSSLFTAFLFRPFMFFILPGLLLLAASAYMWAWGFVRIGQAHADLAGGLSDDSFSSAVALAFDEAPHTFVIGGITLLLAVQLLTLGIISLQQKRYFEELFHLGTAILRRNALPELVPLPRVSPQAAATAPTDDTGRVAPARREL